MKSEVGRLLGRLLICALFLNCFVNIAPNSAEAMAKDRVIVIKADQPNVWTLEQAHYLLAQMHRRNLDLRAKSLDDLDPNEINGLRFDVLRTLIELGVKFDQADLAANRLLSREQNLNQDRRQTLLANRDKLRAESLSLTRDISELQGQKARATTQEEKDRLDAEIAAKTAQRDKVDKEVEFTDNELKTLTAPTGQPTSTKAEVEFDPDKLPKSIFDEAFEAATKKQIEKFNEAPHLNATLRLENFLQMQYEIIAKQLTLLRDEVGPGERLLFLELPQTVNVTHNEADKKWAQSWWRIAGYTKKRAQASVSNDPNNRSSNRSIQSTLQKTNAILDALRPATRATSVFEYVSLEDNGGASISTSVGSPAQTRPVPIDIRSVRTIDLIPRQSSLNVNDMKLRVQSGAFTAVASFLFGFGSRLNIQRQREQFSQFVQQELYSSAFGKGSREFGWTFTPMPGTDRLMSGVRTTYAVVVVPNEANAIVLESNGCYFPRSAYQPNDFSDTNDNSRWGENRTSRGCGSSKAFVVPIPGDESGSDGFWVRSLSFQPVPKGERVVVSISGYNFSSQIGVLINGIPLTHSIGLAQPLIRDDSKAGVSAADESKGEKISGRIERIDSDQIVISFKMPTDYAGTPTITLVAPGKAIDLNWLTIYINDVFFPTQLTAYNRTTKMFGQPPPPVPPEPFRIDNIDVFRSTTARSMTALIKGSGFNNVVEVFANGASLASPRSPRFSILSNTLLRAVFDAPTDEKINFTLVTTNGSSKSSSIANPAFMRISNVTALSYEPASGGKPAILVVKLEGTGFPSDLRALPAKVRVVVTSATEAFLTIPNPNATEVVTLTDPVTRISVNAVISRNP